MIDTLTSVRELAKTRTPEDAFRLGLAVVDLRDYDQQAPQLMQEMASFAHGLDTGRPGDDYSALPRRIMPLERRDIHRMEMFGLRIAELALPLTGIRPSMAFRGRFIIYDEVGHETDDHADAPIDYDHCMTIGVTVSGTGRLLAGTYPREVDGNNITTRLPIRLEEATAIVQSTTNPKRHQVTSLSPGRITAIWDYAS